MAFPCSEGGGRKDPFCLVFLDRKDDLGLLSAVARDLLGRAVSMDTPLVSVFLLMESFIMLSKLKSVLSKYVDTSKNPPKHKKSKLL